jgi:hypothetical protein
LIKTKSNLYLIIRWDGEDGFIKPKNPWFVRGNYNFMNKGMRFMMLSNEAYIGFESLKAFRKEWTV